MKIIRLLLLVLLMAAPAMAQVFCPVCHKDGKTSIVYPGWTECTAMGWTTYYDEQGNYHSDDPNTCTHDYTCSNRHHWGVATKAGKVIGEPSIYEDLPPIQVVDALNTASNFAVSNGSLTLGSVEFTPLMTSKFLEAEKSEGPSAIYPIKNIESLYLKIEALDKEVQALRRQLAHKRRHH